MRQIFSQNLCGVTAPLPAIDFRPRRRDGPAAAGQGNRCPWPRGRALGESGSIGRRGAPGTLLNVLATVADKDARGFARSPMPTRSGLA